MKKGRLLLIDDEELILKRLKLILEDYADEIITAINGVEGLEALAKHEIDCVVCDINMPKLNGVEVLKKIREDKNDVPFIFYTGHGNHELMMQAANLGAFDFLNKPDLDGVEDVVQRGLKKGMNENKSTYGDQSEQYISEYQEMLKQLKINE